MKISVRDFNWLADGTKDTGFIAQQLYGIYPYAVTKGDNGTDAYIPGVTNTWSVDYSKVTPLIVKAIQDLNKKVDSLDDRVGALEAKSLAAAVWNGGLVTNDTTFNGLVTFNKHVVFSGDNAGSVVVPAGQTKADIVFKSSQPNAPKVTATPQEFITGSWRVTAVTANGFSVELQQAQTADATFDWHAFVATDK